jgi:tRNA pseudouridine38-40 synthase
MALKEGFRRYVAALQYRGTSLLGFSYQGMKGENCIIPQSNGACIDLRGVYSVEGRIRLALRDLLGGDVTKFDKIQISSRTDRGVHAIKNTCHIDIDINANLSVEEVRNGLNYYLKQQNDHYSNKSENPFNTTMNDVRILSVLDAPRTMPNFEVMNKLHYGTLPFSVVKHQQQQSDELNDEKIMQWNARFSAIQRKYLYRMIHSSRHTSMDVEGIAFESDQAWIVSDSHPLDIESMKEAASILTGTHDFSSFRNKGCQRLSPIVKLENIHIESHPYRLATNLGVPHSHVDSHNDNNYFCNLISIVFQGNAFVYRQVRNITGCLLHVGRSKLSPSDVKSLLEEKDRTKAPRMAPAHGLFLLDVKHIGIQI